MKRQKVIGVLGGMGPESTAELLLRITRLTPAATEQDHFRVVVDSNPKIPNRTEALLSDDMEPIIKALATTARNLEAAGAEVIGIPCNTAHAFLPDILAAIDTPVVDMVDEAAKRTRSHFEAGTVIGLLATDGTLRSRIYHDALANHELVGLAPSASSVQFAVMDALEAVKLHGVSEETYRALALAVKDLVRNGASALIAGCTEVSLVLGSFPPDLPWMDPLQVLAEALVREAEVEEE